VYEPVDYASLGSTGSIETSRPLPLRAAGIVGLVEGSSASFYWHRDEGRQDGLSKPRGNPFVERCDRDTPGANSWITCLSSVKDVMADGRLIVKHHVLGKSLD